MWVALVVALLAVAGVTACFVVGDRGAPSADTPRMSLDASAKAVEVPLGDPARWEAVEGTWTPRAGETGPVLAQTATDRVFPHILLKDTKLRDVDASVRFRPVSGREDASGGIVFRAADGKNYYLVRANALEDNFRLYTIVDGSRSQIAGARVTAPSLGAWHTLRVVAVGDRIQAYLDGTLLIDFRDTRFAEGRVGLWTKADSVTEFSGFKVTGTQ